MTTLKIPARLTKLVFGLSMLAALDLHADQTDERLDGLFEKLLLVSNPDVLRATENRIWEIWLEHENTDVQQLLTLGTEAMNRRQFPEALLIFSQIVENFPDFAEGWNKRATVLYLLGRYERSIADIKQVLALEKRHFGALSGLGLCYEALGDEAAAVKAYQLALEANPHLNSLPAKIERLRKAIQRKNI